MSIMLIELKPQFIRYECRIEMGRYVNPKDPDGPVIEEERPHHYMINVNTLIEAQGIRFLCPLLFKKNKGSVGTSLILVYFHGRGVPEDQGLNQEGKPVRWNVTGTGYNDLTLKPSIHEKSSNGWHGFITNGKAIDA